MDKRVGPLLLACLLTTGAASAHTLEQPSPTPSATASAVPGEASPTPAASVDERASDRAREWLGRLQRGNIDRSQLTPDLSAALQNATVSGYAVQTGKLGSPTKFTLLGKHAVEGTTTWVFRVTWPQGSMDYTFGVEDATGKISALYLRPGPAG